jgi:hypothetical protein
VRDQPKLGLAGQFSNIKPNSFWIYVFVSPLISDTQRTEIIDSTIALFGRNFQLYHSTSRLTGLTRGGYAFEKGNYYNLNRFPDGSYVEENYLKDDCKIGKVWTSTKKTGNVSLTFTHKVTENGITKIVRNQTFKNVVHVRITSSLGTTDNYYAPEVGLIKCEMQMNSLVFTGELLSYNLK